MGPCIYPIATLWLVLENTDSSAYTHEDTLERDFCSFTPTSICGNLDKVHFSALLRPADE
jgi:hypothetical protein